MKLKRFAKKGGKTNIPERLIQAAAAGGSAVVATAVGAKMSTKMNPNLVGPALLAIGTAAEVFVDNETARAAAKGVVAAGAIRTAAQLSKDKAESNFGLKHFAPVAKDGTVKGAEQASYEELMAQQAQEALDGYDADSDDYDDV